MKRPQFSLRLLLLATALIAAIVGWRTAVHRYNHELGRPERDRMQKELEQLEWEESLGLHSPAHVERIKELQDSIRAFDESM